MQKSGFFLSDAYIKVRAQAALIPAVALSSTDIQSAINDLTSFIQNLNSNTFLELQRRYRNLLLTQGEKSKYAAAFFYTAVKELHPELASRMVQ
jgi:hypothetical protein